MDRLTYLALAAGRGDHHALDRFVVDSYDDVWRLSAALVDSATADDLTQDAFVRIVAALPHYRADSPARTWLLAIARYTCMDELRARSRRRRRDDTLTARQTIDEATTPDASQTPVAADLLSRLDVDRRTAFVLTQVLGLSYQEAGEICRCPPGTIRSRIFRARVDLISQLESESDPGSDRDRTTDSA